MNKRILSILVENTAGVLSRVSGLFSRRGYNIASISAGVTTNPNYTRITVVCTGDELILEQITRQVEKLEDVLSVKVLKDGESVNRELILVKVRVTPEQRPGITAIVDIFRANIIDVGKESMIIEVTGTKSKLEAFINLLDGYEILELARTGITGLSRGAEDVFYPTEEENFESGN
ncbi:MAG TPA: acetolactate synthase small subunit [Candidatus Blautia pullicola]|jgi:acetolactate synthase-1/3 small subunit|uniref:Acetolactate synthase small subunit n=1 Tax=Candidatus Blautia pullicola TaxID=2838498 RepID=A0A9D2FTZ9_9FIRM|nr:acetolactate synthase small subunit [Candidatus Blautia pullicola]